MIISFIWGQKHYSIPYAWKKLLAYIVIVVLLFFAQKAVLLINKNIWIEIATGTLFTFGFILFVLQIEKNETVIKQLKLLIGKKKKQEQ